MHRRHFHLTFFLLLGLPLHIGGQPGQQFAELGDFRLESGTVIHGCRIGYRTFGELDAQKSNAVLFPSWFSGTTEDLIPLIGPGKLVDSARYFVIAVDAFGNGVSSSPSNSRVQAGDSFPEFSIRDMVNAQHQLLTKVLGISHLRAVMGISMGGMQTFQWMVSYPDFLDKAVPIVGSPRLASYDLLLWRAELRAIETARECRCGQEAAMRTVALIHQFALYTPQHRVNQTSHQDFPQFLKEIDTGFPRRFHSKNWASQLRAMMSHDVSAPFAGSLRKAASAVQAQVLVVVATQDHMVNPQPALEFAKLLNAETLELASDCGHIAVSCERERVAEAVDLFLKR